MTFYFKKIMLGLGLSVAGIAFSYGWYKFDLSRSKITQNENKKVVAKLFETKNEVQKKQVSRVIWQAANEDEDLHAGEAIRTSVDSEAKVVFNSGAQIQMDPESVVVIEEAGDKLSLDFIKGNLFFKGGGKKDSLAVKSGNTSIDLKNGEAALNKTRDGRALDVQVVRGTAELDQNGKKVTLDIDKSGVVDDKGLNITQQFVKIKSPVAFSKVYVQTNKKEPVVFEWEKLSENFDIYLEIGQKRENLTRMYPKVPAKAGIMAMQVKLGNYFWRLVAVDNKDANKVYYSQINKLSVLSEIPPKIIQPSEESVATLSPQTGLLALRWSNPSKLEKLHVEIARDPQFSKNVYSEVVADTGVHEAPLSEEGIYYWRVAGFRSGTSKEVASEVKKFVLKTKLDLTPPSLRDPKDGARVQIESIQNGQVFLRWENVLGYSQYQVKVFLDNSQVVFDQKVSDIRQVRFSLVKPGNYKWQVWTIGADGKLSQGSQQRLLVVEELPLLLWADAKEQEQYFYLTPQPQLRIIVRGDERAKQYKINFSYEQGGKNIDKSLPAGSPDKIFDVPQDGLYKVFVEALNDKNQIIARSKVKDIVIQPRPLLPAPEFSDKLADILQASKKGTLDLSFKSVGGAKNYLISFKSPTGQIKKQDKVVGTSITIKGLLPGNYKVSVSSIDEYGRVGPSGKEKLLSVPNISDSKAPKLRKLKVK